MLPMSSLIVRQGRYLQSSYRDRENYFPALVRERNITFGIATLCVSDRTLFWSILMPAIYGKFREEDFRFAYGALTHVSVYTTSAFAIAASGSVVIKTSAPLCFASAFAFSTTCASHL